MGRAHQYWVLLNNCRINMKEIQIKWCPTKEMVADFSSGESFQEVV